jgi:hypothetical protein
MKLKLKKNKNNDLKINNDYNHNMIKDNEKKIIIDDNKISISKNDNKISISKDDNKISISKDDNKINNKLNNMKLCLSDMKEILDENNQEFFLTFGTLLGYYRENNFIKYDYDIDIGIIKSKYNENIKDLIIKSNKFKLNKTYGNIDNSLEYSFKHKTNMIIDIFLYYPENIEDSYYYCATFTGICDFKPGGFCKWGNHIRGFTEIDFFNKKYKIPSNTDEFLTENYGNWKVPKKFNYTQGLAGEYKNLIN